jgi:hypothetical protein
MHKYGFVYLWYDRKHKRYYVGCHWGREDDGYVCSSSWMKQAYKHRPEDFRRKILKSNIQDRKSTYIEEQRWLDMIKPEEIKVRYYNIKITTNEVWHKYDESIKSVSDKVKANHWTKRADSEEIRKKISLSGKGRPNPSAKKSKKEDVKKKISESLSGRKLSEEHSANIGRAISADYASGKRNNDSNIGSKRSEETKAKMREAQRALYSGPRGEEIRKKISEKKRLRDLQKIGTN